MNKSKVVTEFPNLRIGGAKANVGRALTPNPLAGAKQVESTMIPRKAIIYLTNCTIPITEALDYASIKLADLTTGTTVILGALAKLVATGTGGVDTITNLDVAIGTAAASNATLSATMVNVLAKVDAAALGVVESANAVAALAATGATPDLFLNIACAISVDGSVVLNGRIEITYLELGNPAA